MTTIQVQNVIWMEVWYDRSVRMWVGQHIDRSAPLGREVISDCGYDYSRDAILVGRPPFSL